MNKTKMHFGTNLKIMNCAMQETTMRRVTKVANIYNPHQHTYPCNNLRHKYRNHHHNSKINEKSEHQSKKLSRGPRWNFHINQK